MKKIIINAFVSILTLASVAPLEMTNENYNSIDFNDTIAMSFSRFDSNGKKVATEEMSSDNISFFIDQFNDFISYEIVSPNYHELIGAFSQKPISIDKADHLKVAELALFFGQDSLACALLRSYIARFAQYETIETFFDPQNTPLSIKHLLRKLYFLLTDDHRVMTYKHDDRTINITMTLKEVLYGRQVVVKNSVLNLSNLHLSSLDGIAHKNSRCYHKTTE